MLEKQRHTRIETHLKILQGIEAVRWSSIAPLNVFTARSGMRNCSQIPVFCNGIDTGIKQTKPTKTTLCWDARFWEMNELQMEYQRVSDLHPWFALLFVARVRNRFQLTTQSCQAVLAPPFDRKLHVYRSGLAKSSKVKPRYLQMSIRTRRNLVIFRKPNRFPLGTLSRRTVITKSKLENLNINNRSVFMISANLVIDNFHSPFILLNNTSGGSTPTTECL